MMNFLELKELYRKRILEGVGVMANSAVNYFENNITQQKDVRGNDFDRRKYDTRERVGRAILVKTGNLRRSIKIKNITNNSVEITADMTYAEIHNEGGEIIVTQKMKKFFWAKFYEAQGQDASFWRGMALKKIGEKIIIPQREFMAETPELQDLLQKEFQAYLNGI